MTWKTARCLFQRSVCLDVETTPHCTNVLQGFAVEATSTKQMLSRSTWLAGMRRRFTGVDGMLPVGLSDLWKTTTLHQQGDLLPLQRSRPLFSPVSAMTQAAPVNPYSCHMDSGILLSSSCFSFYWNNGALTQT